jgi:ABC-type dipeptide/oligopeptide/nickel transport system ATPase component
MRIVNMVAANVKKIRVVDITPEGNIVTITGANGSGKSSVLDSIYWALAGAGNISDVPIRKGEHRALIRLNLGDVIVTRHFTEATEIKPARTTLKLESADGARFERPQQILDELYGALTFDPLEFSRMKPKEQLLELKKVVAIDVDFDELDRLNAGDFAKRTDLSRDIRRMQTIIEEKNAKLVARFEEKPEPVDVSALLKELESVAAHNVDVDREHRRRLELASKAERLRGMAKENRAKAEELLRLAEEQDGTASSYTLELSNAPAIAEKKDPTAIRAEIDRANVQNEGARELADLQQQAAVMEENVAAAEQLTRQIAERNEIKASAIARAKMPIAGLSFDESTVLYNNLPLEQASSAEQLRISIAIAMAANPKLRVLRIKDGSLLDDNNLKLIGEMAAADNYQIWIERVEIDAGVGIVMEDGAIVGAPAPADPFPAATAQGIPHDTWSLKGPKPAAGAE